MKLDGGKERHVKWVRGSKRENRGKKKKREQKRSQRFRHSAIDRLLSCFLSFYPSPYDISRDGAPRTQDFEWRASRRCFIVLKLTFIITRISRPEHDEKDGELWRRFREAKTRIITVFKLDIHVYIMYKQRGRKNLFIYMYIQYTYIYICMWTNDRKWSEIKRTVTLPCCNTKYSFDDIHTCFGYVYMLFSIENNGRNCWYLIIFKIWRI